MADRIASGEIHIEVNDREALASLRRIDSEFERTMRDIDREKATVDLDANVAGLKKDLAEAEALVKRHEAKIRAVKTKAAKENNAAKKAEAEATRAALEQELRAALERRAEQQRHNKGLALTEKRLAAITKRDEARARVEAKAAREREKALLAEARLRDRNDRARLREERAEERRARLREREIRDVPRLEQAYVRLHDKLDKLAEARRRVRRPFDKRANLRIDVDERATLDEIERLRTEIRRRVGRDPIEIPVKPESGRRFGEFLRVEMGRNNGVLSAVGVSMGLHLGRSMRVGMARGMERGILEVGGSAVARLGGNLGRGLLSTMARIAHAAGGLADSTVRIGPFTTTIRKAIIGLSLFAPILLDVVGALSALTGSIGAATLGIGALGTALVGGGIPAMLGMGLVIKQVIGEFTDVAKAQKAYDDALQKGNTDLAAKKMKELKAVMGNVSKETVRQIGLWDRVQAQFKRDTAPARAAVWKTIGEGIQTASDMMPLFTRRTNEAMGVASRGITEWMKDLRSAAGRAAIDEMMGNFNAALGPALDGMGSLLAYFGRVGQIASRFLPGMASNFRAWADGVNSVSTSDLEGKVERVINSARALGRFLMAAGRLMKAFFGAGVSEGDRFLDVMTNAMNGWTAWINSIEGQNSLSNFFNESVEGTRSLWNTLQPVIASFVRWAASIAPVSRAFFDGAAAVAEFVSELVRLTGTAGWVSGLATTLGALWAFGKIRAATTAMTGFIAGLRGVAATETAVAGSAARSATALNAQATAAARATAANRALAASNAAAAGSALLPLGGGAMSAAGGTKSAAAAAATASRWQKVGAALNAASLATLGMKASTAGLIGVAVAGGVAILDLANKTSDLEVDLESAGMAADKFAQRTQAGLSILPGLADQMQTGALGLESTQLTVAQLRRQLRGLDKGTLEYKTTLNQLRQVRQQEAQQAQDMLTTMNAEHKARTDTKLAADETVRSTGEQVKKAEEWLEAQKALPRALGKVTDAEEKLDDARKEHKAALAAQIVAQEQATLSYYNQQRALAGLPKMALTAARAFSQLQKAGGKQLATKIALKYDDPNKAARVGASAAKALKAGAGRGAVMRIIADSRNVDQTIRRLNAIRMEKKTQKILADDSDIRSKLRRIVGEKLAPKVQRILGGDDDAKTKIRKLIALGIPPKVAQMLGDNRDALRKAREANLQRLNTLTQWIQRIIRNPANLNFVPSVTQFVNRVIRGPRADGGAFASGGHASRPDPRKQDRAAQTAALSGNPRRAIGQKITKPTYLTGEEASTEVVVTSNPAYRERNKRYAAMAARMVGLVATDPSNGGMPIMAADGYMGGDFTNGGRGPGFRPEAEIKRNKRFKPKKKKGNKFTGKRAARPWNVYVGNLQTQQEYWEREVSIRESKVREPEDMIIRAPENDKPVIDPISGKPAVDDDGKPIIIEAFKANPALAGYKQALQRVIDAMNTLMDIVRELVRAIPHAINANRTEFSDRGDAIKRLQDRIEDHKASKRKAPKDKKGEWQDRIDKLQNKVEDHREHRRNLNDDHALLKESRVEAGFDWREYVIARGELREERDSVMPEAKAEAKEANDQATADATEQAGGGGGSGGGRDSEPLSYSAQAALADTEKANILKAFGSNFSPTSIAGIGRGGSGPGTGMQGGLSALGSFGVGGGVAPSAGGAAVASSGSAAGAVAGGVAPIGGAAPAGGGETKVEGDKTVIVQAQFAEVPPDPHTFVKGVEFEVAAVI